MCVYIYRLSRCTSVVGGQVNNVLVLITFLNDIYIYICLYKYLCVYIYIYVYI